VGLRKIWAGGLEICFMGGHWMSDLAAGAIGMTLPDEPKRSKQLRGSTETNSRA